MNIAGDKTFKLKMREVENAFRYRRIPYPKRSIEIVTLLAVSCTLFLFFHTNKLNSRLKEMEEKLQPPEFSALGLTGNGIGPRHSDMNSLQGTYQFLKNTGQLETLNSNLLNNTQFARRDFLLFNRVPKVGSEQLIELIRRLSQKHGFGFQRAVFSEPVRPRLNEEDQENLVYKIMDMDEPAFYAMHVNFIDFKKFDQPKPIYINMVRDPIERVISWFYYRRAPWVVVQSYKIQKTMQKIEWYKKDFTKCVETHDRECWYPKGLKFRQEIADHKRQSLFFCGHEPECEPFNTDAAIQLAMKNVERDFAVVGSWEDVNVTLTVLEHYIPKYFKGLRELYFDPKNGLATDVRNSNPFKPAISEAFKDMLSKNFSKEYEFYSFCKQRLYKQYFAIKKEGF